MAHKRTDIRNALKAMLLGNTAAGSNVYTNRAHNIDAAKLPAIHIYDESENAESRDIRGIQSRRRVTLKIEAKVKGSSNYDVTLDNLVLQIENIIKADITLQGTANGVVYQNTEMEYEAAEQVIATATLTYEILYIS